eukprot:TRINITY_DN11399_c0_g1_i1.p1 TRINITY_DN11399_c0_g1~~TRINITY_DN11399_c0_g1_i1.p1  ORF type:complete len:748 (+),score=111.44 TRINITY_DN11399_c0_g1_i1:327-2246(+)
MKSLIPTFAKVQDALSAAGYTEADNYPQIVVIGVQSSGKSSILEMIVGENFLPKGEGTVTKRPLILTLHNTLNDPTIKDKQAKWGIFPDDNGNPITDFTVIEKRIKTLNKNLNAKPVRLEIYSPDVVDLRLVDLPGLIHNPTREQPEDMRQLIKNICSHHIKNPNTVILAISPANQDLQTSESLRFARKHDPQGQRTISVLSKMDLCTGRDLTNLASTIKKLPLRLGYVGVVCRNQRDLNTGMTIPQAVAREKQFFELNRQYSQAGLNVSTAKLATELSSMLSRQVRRAIPRILHELHTDLKQAKDDRNIVGAPTPRNATERDRLLIREIGRFLKAIVGPATITKLKSTIAELLYASLREHCNHRIAESKRRQIQAKSKSESGGVLSFLWGNKNKKNIDMGDIPQFWDGMEDTKFLEWRASIRALVDDLMPLSAHITSTALDMIREEIEKTNVLNHRPALQDAIKATTYEYLNHNHDKTVERLQYLITLERSISYNAQNISMDVYRMKREESTESGAVVVGEEKKGWGSMFGLGGNGNAEKIFIAEKYDPLWTQAYCKHLTERLANNMYNALCLEIFDVLQEDLEQVYITDLYGNDPNRRDALLQETPEIEEIRKGLDLKVEELENALQTLQQLSREYL